MDVDKPAWRSFLTGCPYLRDLKASVSSFYAYSAAAVVKFAPPSQLSKGTLKNEHCPAGYAVFPLIVQHEFHPTLRNNTAAGARCLRPAYCIFSRLT